MKIETTDDKNNFKDDENLETTDKVNDVEKTEPSYENTEENAEENIDSNTNLYSPSNPYDEESELDTTKETAEIGESLPGTKESEQANERIESQTLAEEPDKATEINDDVNNTQVQSSSHLANATPSSIRTRRASKLAQNN